LLKITDIIVDGCQAKESSIFKIVKKFWIGSDEPYFQAPKATANRPAPFPRT
jgi:hypothetical protein